MLHCGDAAGAATRFQQALEQVRAGKHPAWASLASGRLAALCANGESERAQKLGRRWLEKCESEQLGVVPTALLSCTALLGLPSAAPAAQEDSS